MSVMIDLSNPYGTAFGLLDQVYGEGTAKAMQEHGGPCEMFDGHWSDIINPVWSVSCVYRVKPAPPNPREWWIVDDCEAYPNLADAEQAKRQLHSLRPISIVHVREVIE